MRAARIVAALLAGLAGSAPSSAGELDGAVFRVTLETEQLGPVETQLAFEASGEEVRARSLSGPLDETRALPGARGEDLDLSRALFALEARATGDGYAGALTAPSAEAQVSFSVTGRRLEGTIKDGLFSGSFAGDRADEVERLRDYPSLLERLDAVVRAKIFDPEDLDTEAYRLFRERLGEIAGVARDDIGRGVRGEATARARHRRTHGRRLLHVPEVERGARPAPHSR